MNVKPFVKWGLILLFVLYVISPIDLIPDIIPIVGWIDDAVAILLAFLTLWRL